MVCVALKLVSTAFCRVCYSACSLKFISMAYIATQVSFMACVALKLVSARFVLKFVFMACTAWGPVLGHKKCKLLCSYLGIAVRT